MKCLFVAGGPSGPDARRHAGWGEVATLNRGLELVDHADWAFFGTPGKVPATAAGHGRALRLVPLFRADAGGGSEEAYATLRATGRLVELPYVSCEGREQPRPGQSNRDARREYVEKGGVLGRAGVAIVQLKNLGYTHFWLFGHDGGHDRAGALAMEPSRRGYDTSRFSTAVLLEHLKLTHAFWPNTAPT